MRRTSPGSSPASATVHSPTSRVGSCQGRGAGAAGALCEVAVCEVTVCDVAIGEHAAAAPRATAHARSPRAARAIVTPLSVGKRGQPRCDTQVGAKEVPFQGSRRRRCRRSVMIMIMITAPAASAATYPAE